MGARIPAESVCVECRPNWTIGVPLYCKHDVYVMSKCNLTKFKHIRTWGRRHIRGAIEGERKRSATNTLFVYI